MKKQVFNFAVASSVMSILFFIIVNMITSEANLWFIYPTYAILWWPISVYFANKKSAKGLAIVGSGVTIAFVVLTNLITSPQHPWCLYVIFPILWWPLVLHIGRKAGTVKFALLSSGAIILYYAALNLWLSPVYPWVIYPTFAVLWWPLSLYFAYKKNPLAYACIGSIHTIVFFVVVNWVSSPAHIWAVYPAFAVLWWPLSIYYFVHLKDAEYR
ncbi:MAG: hypothetical protein H7X94_10955 [Vallitaleaceae bacterium]|nr:hypothetical protein [Vallitaleaceae bacterium]